MKYSLQTCNVSTIENLLLKIGFSTTKSGTSSIISAICAMWNTIKTKTNSCIYGISSGINVWDSKLG